MAEKKIKTIGVLTSGGDAPGTNAAMEISKARNVKMLLKKSVTIK